MEPIELAKMYQEVGGIRYYKTVTTSENTIFGSCSLCGAVCTKALWEQHTAWHESQDKAFMDSMIQDLKNMAKDLDHDAV
jgi:hypothetical protein